jgi:hypothetical protein
MLILPSIAKDWHLHLHICIYLNKPLGLPAPTGCWNGNKPMFWKPSVLISSVMTRSDMVLKHWFIRLSTTKCDWQPKGVLLYSVTMKPSDYCVYYKILTLISPLCYNNNKTNHSSTKHNCIFKPTNQLNIHISAYDQTIITLYVRIKR